MRTAWLMEHAGPHIRYQLSKDASLVPALTQSAEGRYWLELLADRVQRGDLSNLHGSHDYRYENIMGKSWLLGFDADVPAFDAYVRFFLNALERQLEAPQEGPLTFRKLYQYRDYETVMACYLPFLGYGDVPCVQQVARKRIDILYAFARQGRYDLYKRDTAYPGVKKEWKALILDPALYADGNIAIPSIHDCLLMAGLYAGLDRAAREKIDAVLAWMFAPEYAALPGSFYFYAPQDPSYKAKQVHGRVQFPAFSGPLPDGYDLQALLFTVFLFAHFRPAQKADWFVQSMMYLEGYRTEAERYTFPRGMLVERKDCYVYKGGHMGAGEDRRNPLYAELLSTYWMERIERNLRALRSERPSGS